MKYDMMMMEKETNKTKKEKNENEIFEMLNSEINEFRNKNRQMFEEYIDALEIYSVIQYPYPKDFNFIAKALPIFFKFISKEEEELHAIIPPMSHTIWQFIKHRADASKLKQILEKYNFNEREIDLFIDKVKYLMDCYYSINESFKSEIQTVLSST